MAPGERRRIEQQHDRLPVVSQRLSIGRAPPAGTTSSPLIVAMPVLPDLHPVDRGAAVGDGDVQIAGVERGREALHPGPTNELVGVGNLR